MPVLIDLVQLPQILYPTFLDLANEAYFLLEELARLVVVDGYALVNVDLLVEDVGIEGEL